MKPLSIITDGREEALELATTLAHWGYTRQGWGGSDPLEGTLGTINNHFDSRGAMKLTYTIAKDRSEYGISAPNDPTRLTAMPYQHFLYLSAYNEG